MSKKKPVKRVLKINQEENFRFALNAAVLAVLLGVLVMLVRFMPYMHLIGSRASGN
jgi:uncharacterized membrane protein